MSPLEIAFLTLATVGTSALTATVGAGGGTLLMAIMLQMAPPAVVIPVQGVVQLAQNAARTWLFWRHLHWPIILRFSLPMPFGVWLGLEVFQGLSAETIQIIIGCFILASLFLRQIGRFRESEVPLWMFWPMGFATGALNMIVGLIAPILGVLIIRKDLTKEGMVGTLGVFGFVGNVLKVAGFALFGFSFAEYASLLIFMVPAAIIGTRLGKAFLSGLNPTTFLIVFRIVLATLALKLIFIDGLAGLLA